MRETAEKQLHDAAKLILANRNNDQINNSSGGVSICRIEIAFILYFNFL